MFQLLIGILLLLLYLFLEHVDSLDELVLSLFLDKDLLGWLHSWLTLKLLLGNWVIVLHGETSQHTIETDREELAVVVVKSHTLDLLAVRLYLNSFLNELLGVVAENLD